MNEIRQHIPNWADGFDQRKVEFETLEELRAIDWVKQFTVPIPPIKIVNVLKPDEPVEQPKSSGPFHRFSQSVEWPEQPFSRRLLMAEFNEGATWWVVGYLKEKVEGLPEWHAPTDD